MNIAALERDRAAKLATARGLLEKYTHAAAAHTEPDGHGGTITGRLITAEERREVEGLVAESEAIKATIDRAKGDQDLAAQIAALGLARPGAPAPVEHGAPPALRASLGAQFVASEAYDWLRKTSKMRGSSWNSPAVELHDPAIHGATLSETGPPVLNLPDFQPGIYPLPMVRPVVADLIAPGTTDGNMVTYMREDSMTNAADTVAEGAAKPESTIVLSVASDPVRKIAHWLPVTEELLEDASQIRSYIDSRLRYGVMLAEEDQLLNGTATPPDIVGIRNRAGLAPDVVRDDVSTPKESNADAIYRQIMAIFNLSGFMPDGIVLNPANWQVIQLSKDAQGRYMGLGPFSPSPAPMLWGLPVVVTPRMPITVGLVGAYRAAAQIFRKGGIRVEATNSHADYFVKNIVAIRAEERLALAVYRPSAFGEVTVLA